MEDMGGVHNALDEEHVIFGAIIVVIKDGQLAELRASRCYVHVRDGPLEAGALWCWLEGLDKVLTKVLVYQDQRHFIIEWPLEQSITFSLHQNEEDRQMCLVAYSITIKVDPDAHLVTILSRIERWAVEGRYSPIDCISLTLCKVWDPPHKRSITSRS